MALLNRDSYSQMLCWWARMVKARRCAKVGMMPANSCAEWSEASGALVAQYVSRALYATKDPATFGRAILALHLPSIGVEVFNKLFPTNALRAEGLDPIVAVWNSEMVGVGEDQAPGVLPQLYWERLFKCLGMRQYQVNSKGMLTLSTLCGSETRYSAVFARFYLDAVTKYALPHAVIFPLFFVFCALLKKPTYVALLTGPFFRQYITPAKLPMVTQWLADQDYNQFGRNSSAEQQALRVALIEDWTSLLTNVHSSFKGSVAYQDVLPGWLTAGASSSSTILEADLVGSELFGDVGGELQDALVAALALAQSGQPEIDSLANDWAAVDFATINDQLGAQSAHALPTQLVEACSPSEAARRERQRRNDLWYARPSQPLPGRSERERNRLRRLRQSGSMMKLEHELKIQGPRPSDLQVGRMLLANLLGGANMAHAGDSEDVAMNLAAIGTLIGDSLRCDGDQSPLACMAVSTSLQQGTLAAGDFHELLGALYDGSDAAGFNVPDVKHFHSWLGPAQGSISPSEGIKQFITGVCTSATNWKRLWSERWPLTSEVSTAVERSRTAGVAPTTVSALLELINTDAN
jgi:hypothetical protein